MSMMSSHLFLAIIVFVAAFLIMLQFSERILDWVRFQSIGTRDYIVERLKLMMIEIDPERVLLYQSGVTLLFSASFFYLGLPNVAFALVLAIIGGGVGWFAPKPVVDYLYRRRCQAFVLQMVDGLGLMSNGMRSGLSVVQALGLVANEMPSPIKEEFERILAENKLGISVEEAFVSLSKRVISDEVEMFVTSVNILKETGGNLAETFDTITLMIRERIKVENKISALTAQAYGQGMILMAVPPFMFMVLSSTDPETMKPMLNHPIGWAIIAGVIVLEIAAFFVIKKITTIEV